MNMKQFEYVTILAREKSFSKAAQLLEISQPSLSQYIKKIENDLNEELFVRKGSTVKLTEAGKIYLDIGKKILDLEQEMYSKLSDLKENKTGRMVIGVSPFRSVCIMPKAIKEFHKKYPGIQIVLDENISDNLKINAEKGMYDLCVSTLPINEAVFNYENMLDEETVVAVPQDYGNNTVFKALAEEKKGRAFPVIDIGLLKNENFVVLGKEQRFQKMFDELCIKNNIEINKIVECKNAEAAYSMVLEGIGLAALPYSLVKNGKNSKSADYYLIKQLDTVRDTVVFFNKEAYLTEPVKYMIEILKHS